MIKIFLLIITVILSGCSGVKDAFTLKKKTNTDQFLVEKKNPLVMPPDFSSLPKPMATQSDQNLQTNDNDNDIKNLLKNENNNKKVIKENKKNNTTSLEKLILEKIN